MHIVLAILYGFTVWISAIAYMAIAGGPVGLVAISGPVIISGAIAFLYSLDLAISALRRLWA